MQRWAKLRVCKISPLFFDASIERFDCTTNLRHKCIWSINGVINTPNYILNIIYQCKCQLILKNISIQIKYTFSKFQDKVKKKLIRYQIVLSNWHLICNFCPTITVISISVLATVILTIFIFIIKPSLLYYF